MIQMAKIGCRDCDYTAHERFEDVEKILKEERCPICQQQKKEMLKKAETANEVKKINKTFENSGFLYCKEQYVMGGSDREIIQASCTSCRFDDQWMCPTGNPETGDQLECTCLCHSKGVNYLQENFWNKGLFGSVEVRK